MALGGVSTDAFREDLDKEKGDYSQEKEVEKRRRGKRKKKRKKRMNEEEE